MSGPSRKGVRVSPGTLDPAAAGKGVEAARCGSAHRGWGVAPPAPVPKPCRQHRRRRAARWPEGHTVAGREADRAGVSSRSQGATKAGGGAPVEEVSGAARPCPKGQGQPRGGRPAAPGAFSSTGESSGLLNRGLQVRVLQRPPAKRNAPRARKRDRAR